MMNHPFLTACAVPGAFWLKTSAAQRMVRLKGNHDHA